MTFFPIHLFKLFFAELGVISAKIFLISIRITIRMDLATPLAIIRTGIGDDTGLHPESLCPPLRLRCRDFFALEQICLARFSKALRNGMADRISR